MADRHYIGSDSTSQLSWAQLSNFKSKYRFKSHAHRSYNLISDSAQTLGPLDNYAAAAAASADVAVAVDTKLTL